MLGFQRKKRESRPESAAVTEGPGDIEDGQRTVRYPNGDVYEGGFEDGLFNGYGKYTFANGDVYEGEWRDGKCEGRGRFTSVAGEVLDGDWMDGEFVGRRDSAPIA